MKTNGIVDQYLTGLRERLSTEDKAQFSYTCGATATQLESLKERFPDCPDALLQLLSRVNGTYWQEYGDKEVAVLILGSDVYEYPYYLKSVAQILEENTFKQSIHEMYTGYLDEFPDLVGAGINPDLNMSRWLCFSDCMNNGGTSRLFLDFDPAPGGTKGQVVRFLHDPDSFKVIATSFEEYLQKLMEHDYDFIQPEEEV